MSAIRNIISFVFYLNASLIEPYLPETAQLLTWTVGTAVLILAVLALRCLLKNQVSCRIRYALWAIVLVRALLPFQLSVSAPLGSSHFIPDPPESFDARTIPVYTYGTIDFENAHEYDRGVEPGELTSTAWSSGYVARSQDGETLTFYWDVYSPAQVVQYVWLLGAIVTAGALMISNVRFRKTLKKSRREWKLDDCPIPLYVAHGLPSPCLAGTFQPEIYLTPDAAGDPTRRRHVLAHELTHYAHKDHIWAFLRCLCLCLHWFNPLVWFAVWLSKRDCELACDEGTVARLGEAERIPYGRTLVDMVAQNGKANLLSCSTTMTEGKKTIQQRIERLVKHPETKKTALFLAVSLLALAAVFSFAGGAEEPAAQENLPSAIIQEQYWEDPAKGYDQLMDALSEAYALAFHDSSSGLYFSRSSETYGGIMDPAVELLSQAQPLTDPVEDFFDSVPGERIDIYNQTAATQHTEYGILSYYLKLEDEVYYLLVAHNGIYSPVATLDASAGEALLALAKPVA